MRRRLLWLALSLLPLANAHGDAAYLDELVQQARTLRLAERPEWHRLMHYEPRALWPGVESLVDAPTFFHSPDGKHDPKAELEATLASFFSPMAETPERQHPQCAFVARYHWLARELAFDRARLIPQPCARYREWRSSLDAQEITLVFPAAFLNSPASMYGHTLLRVDAKSHDERTRLLAYSISYAASTDETNGFLFAIKGLFGGYPGVFSTAPYYLKVREYTDIENRDIWEYRLNFTPEEIDRLLMHAWELGPIYFDYYFFDENCAYHLLSLFEVARPGLRLTDEFDWWAIPSDTVRAVAEAPGLLKQAVYRPSAATILRHRIQDVSSTQRELAKALAEQRLAVDSESINQLSTPDRATVLELGYEYLNYLRMSGKRKGDEVERHAHRLLLARSRLAASAAPATVPVPEVRPDQGHGSARIGAGIGSEEDKSFIEIDLRPTYHGLMDDESGYIRGAQTEFFHTRVRYYTSSSDTRVEVFTPITIVSLSPRDEFFTPISWKASVGWSRRIVADGTEPLVFHADVAGGYSWEYRSRLLGPTSLYALLDTSVIVDDAFEDRYALGAGPALGVLADPTPEWRVHLTGRYRRFGFGDYHSDRELTLSQRYTLGRNDTLRFDLARRRTFDRAESTATLYWFRYF